MTSIRWFSEFLSGDPSLEVDCSALDAFAEALRGATHRTAGRLATLNGLQELLPSTYAMQFRRQAVRQSQKMR